MCVCMCVLCVYVCDVCKPCVCGGRARCVCGEGGARRVVCVVCTGRVCVAGVCTPCVCGREVVCVCVCVCVYVCVGIV